MFNFNLNIKIYQDDINLLLRSLKFFEILLKCYICKKSYKEGKMRVKYHDHITRSKDPHMENIIKILVLVKKSPF